MKSLGKSTLVTVVALALVAFAACRREHDPEARATVTIAVENDIQTLDPTVLSDPHTSRVVWQIYEGLVGLDRDDRVVPVLAESWESTDDDRVWTFSIRQGARFHPHPAFGGSAESREVTAQDVGYSYQRFAKGFGSFVFSGLVEGFDDYVGGDSSEISGFAAIDPRTFQVRLVRPDPSFIYRLSSPYLGVMPREVVEADTDAFGLTVASGTGPFRLEQRTPTEVRLGRNQDYWREADGNLERIVFRVEKNPQFLAAQLEDGSYSLAQLPLQLYPQFFSDEEIQARYSASLRAYSKVTYNVHYVGIDCAQVEDAVLRRAMTRAVDREAIVRSLLYGQGRVASGPVPLGMLGYQPPPPTPADLTFARDLVAESSYDGRPLTLLVSDAGNSEQIGEVVQNSLQQAGLKVNIQKVDFNTLISRVFGDRPDLFVLFSEWVFGAPELVLDVYDSAKVPNPNMFGCGDQRVDDLLAVARQAGSREQINRALQDAEQVAQQMAAALWLFHLRSIYLMDTQLEGFWVDGHNHWNLADVHWRDGP